jgi:hypothetical protein
LLYNLQENTYERVKHSRGANRRFIKTHLKKKKQFFFVQLRIFHSYWDVTITGDRRLTHAMTRDLCFRSFTRKNQVFSLQNSEFMTNEHSLSYIWHNFHDGLIFTENCQTVNIVKLKTPLCFPRLQYKRIGIKRGQTNWYTKEVIRCLWGANIPCQPCTLAVTLFLDQVSGTNRNQFQCVN